MKRKKNNFVIPLVLAIVVFIIFSILTLPIFKVSTVKITGINKVSESYIKNVCAISSATNIFTFNKFKAINSLKKSSYIANVKIIKQLPDKIFIEITEREPCAYVLFEENLYLFIDKEGRVLEVSKAFTEKLPIIVGLSVNEFNIGQILSISNEEALKSAVLLANLFNIYDLSQEVIRLDVTDEFDIHLFVYNIDVEFGEITNSETKVAVLKEALQKIPDVETVKGFLNLNIKNPNELARFRILT